MSPHLATMRGDAAYTYRWDFGCPTELTAEAVPSEAERGAAMQWYWEAGHFKKELGDLVLARALGESNETDGFGLELTTANVGERNTVCRAALKTVRPLFRLPDTRPASTLSKRVEPNGSLK